MKDNNTKMTIVQYYNDHVRCLRSLLRQTKVVNRDQFHSNRPSSMAKFKWNRLVINTRPMPDEMWNSSDEKSAICLMLKQLHITMNKYNYR